MLCCPAVRAQANNSLAGGLSAEWLSALPPALDTLLLYDNPLGGSFPGGVDLSHTRLATVSLGGNQLSGTLPADVTWPTTLQYLSFVSDGAGVCFSNLHVPGLRDRLGAFPCEATAQQVSEPAVDARGPPTCIVIWFWQCVPSLA